ncbi:hypothetical protein COO91_04060 [Nostoc flagelliforme CCNUN1]|uniref:Uncharacterized protein n=1 Tax=Nostoc flagelliforme CCNUN1 TaxID=2038116 RepID=A0A2K8SRP2_9NOSO|nr:hypothetical protein COO91_04060 [Nostoc flagelliforme CCNUN1]
MVRKNQLFYLARYTDFGKMREFQVLYSASRKILAKLLFLIYVSAKSISNPLMARLTNNFILLDMHRIWDYI